MKTIDEAIAENLTCECTKDKMCAKCQYIKEKQDEKIQSTKYSRITKLQK